MLRSTLPFLTLLAACTGPDTSQVRIIGHGGGGDQATLPMNSEASILGALALGVDGIELDVQLTADSILVAYHAQDLAELTACTGLINGMTYAMLKACPVLGRDSLKHPIQRLDSLLSRAAQAYPGTDFTLDCKLFAQEEWWPYLEAYTDAVVALNRLPPVQGRLLVECQVDDFLLLLQRKQPYLPLYRYASDLEEAIWRATASHFTGVVVSNDRAPKRLVQKAHELGLEVTIFGVGGHWSHRNAIRKSPDRVQTDAPAILLPQGH